MAADFFAILRDGETHLIPLRREIQDALEEQFRRASAPLVDDVEFVPVVNYGFRPDVGEVIVIPDFPLPPPLATALENPRGTPRLSTAAERLGEIKGIIARFEDEGRLWCAAQVIDKRQVIKPEGLSFILSGNVFRRLEEPGLHVGEEVHAVLTDGHLVFANPWWARRLFDIGRYYRQATDRDLADFLAQQAITAEDAAVFAAGANEWVRRRIALIQDSGVLQRCPPVLIRERAAEYGIPVTLTEDESSIVLPVDKQVMKQVVKFLGEDIYHGPLTNTPFESNSKRRLR